jgi:hypothetical protein
MRASKSCHWSVLAQFIRVAEQADRAGVRAKRSAELLRRGSGDGMSPGKAYATREAP